VRLDAPRCTSSATRTYRSKNRFYWLWYITPLAIVAIGIALLRPLRTR